MDKFRMRFEKTGRAIYTSHLDLMRNMQRSFARAGFELKYSEGFNPHPKISILSPLPVAVSSVCELMDFELNGDYEPEGMAEKLTAAMPEGLLVKEVYTDARKVAELKWIEIEGRLEYDSGISEILTEQLREFFSQDDIVVNKKTKKGMADVNIAPGINSLSFTADNGAIAVKAVLSAAEPTVGPQLLTEALSQNRPELLPDYAEFTRIETYDCNFNVFR